MATAYDEPALIEVNMASIEALLERLEKKLSQKKGHGKGIVVVYGDEEVPAGTPSNTYILRVEEDLRNL